MSRIGRKPIPVPATVDLVIGEGNIVTVKGPKGQLSATFAPSMILERENGTLNVSRPDDERRNRSLHGLTRTLISNMVVGVTDGFRKNLEITMNWQGGITKKKFVSTIVVHLDTSKDKEWEVLNIEYSDDNKVSPAKPDQNKIQDLIKKFNK